MKKTLKLLLIVCGVFLLTACGGDDKKEDDAPTTKVICKQEIGSESYQVVAELKNDKVVGLSAEASFENEEKAAAYEEFVNFMGTTKNSDTKVKREGTKLTIGNYAPVVESDTGENKVVVIGESKENLANVLRRQNYKCE